MEIIGLAHGADGTFAIRPADERGVLPGPTYGYIYEDDGVFRIEEQAWEWSGKRVPLETRWDSCAAALAELGFWRASLDADVWVKVPKPPSDLGADQWWCPVCDTTGERSELGNGPMYPCPVCWAHTQGWGMVIPNALYCQTSKVKVCTQPPGARPGGFRCTMAMLICGGCR